MKKALFITVLLAILVSACSKYPEDSGFSLLTRDSRINGQWEVTQLFVNNTDSTVLFTICGAAQYHYSFWVDGGAPDGSGGNAFFSFTGTGTTNYGDYVSPNGVIQDAVFNLNTDDSQISFSCLPPASWGFPSGVTQYYPYSPIISTQTITWDILRLTNSQMWLQTSYSNGKKYELRLAKIGATYCGVLEH